MEDFCLPSSPYCNLNNTDHDLKLKIKFINWNLCVFIFYFRCYKWSRFCGLEDRFGTALDMKDITRICMDHFDKAPSKNKAYFKWSI